LSQFCEKLQKCSTARAIFTWHSGILIIFHKKMFHGSLER
jgi:hypothetical protein